MGASHKQWAREARVRLIERLGGECEACGSRENLEFDCVKPCGDRHHKMDTSARMCFYHGQERAGNLQLLCSGHNNAKSLSERAPYVPRLNEWASALMRRMEACR